MFRLLLILAVIALPFVIFLLLIRSRKFDRMIRKLELPVDPSDEEVLEDAKEKVKVVQCIV